MRRAWQVGICSALCLFAAPVFAQAPTRIELGQRVGGTAASEGGAFYAFAAVQGTRLNMQLTLPDTLAAVALYDVNGAEIAHAEGQGSVSLSHTLQDDGIYLIGVTSAATGKDYTLVFDGQEPRIEYVYDDPAPAPQGPPQPTASPASPSPSAPPVPATPAFAADPAVWGVYARLAGRHSVPTPGTYQLVWVWTKPGEELREEWRDGTGRVASTITITPTGQAGELLQRSSALGGKEWRGRIGEDGRVTFVGSGLFKLPFVVDISPDGLFQLRRAKVDDNGRATSIQPANERSQWALAPAD